MRRFVPLLVALLLAACSRDASNPAPPRVTTPTAIPSHASTIAIPITARLADLQAMINAEVPKTLVEIDRQENACIPAQRLTACAVPKLECKKGLKCRKVGCEVGLKNARITSDISCRIVGQVRRGPITLSGAGDVIKLAMPVSATVQARDIGKVIKSETATAAAEVRANVRLGVSGDWQPGAKITIDYDWTQKPGIELLGKRITFAGKADPQLAKLIARLEAEIPRNLARLHARDQLATAWAKGFTVVQLNARNPPVWLRITPRQLRYDGYRVAGGDLVLDLAAMARTETFVGDLPPDPPVTPLPPPATLIGGEGFRFHIPVVADYAELEPVLEKALGKLSKKPITLPVVGVVRPSFGAVTMYATTGGRLAIGVEMSVATPRRLLAPRGTVWLTGVPYNEPGSQRILVRDLTIAGRPLSPSFALLLAVAQSKAVMAELQGALSQDFARDFNKIVTKAENAIAEKRLGRFQLKAQVTQLRHGIVQPVGQGLYLPVDATGTAALTFQP